MIRVSTIALEAYSPEQIETAKQDFIAKAKPFDTPEEFAAIYTEAKGNDGRELLRKAARAASIPESEQVIKMTTLIDNLRWKGGEDLAWSTVKTMFPQDTTQQIMFYAQTLLLYGRKLTPQLLEELIYDWDLGDFLVEHYSEIKANPAAIDELMQDKIIAKDDAIANQGNFSKVAVDQEVAELEFEMSLLEVVEDIINKKLDIALSEFIKIMSPLGNKPKDVAEMFGELLKLFGL